MTYNGKKDYEKFLQRFNASSKPEDLVIDSLDYLNMLIQLEGEFELELDGVDTQKLSTIGEILSYIGEKVSAKYRPKLE